MLCIIIIITIKYLYFIYIKYITLKINYFIINFYYYYNLYKIGLEIDKLVDLTHEELLGIVHARARRRMMRGLNKKPMALIKKLRKAKLGMYL